MNRYLPDVNVLIYAHREEMQHHPIARDWLEERANSADTVLLLKPVLASFLRIVTNRRIFATPTPTSEAFLFVSQFTAASGFQITDLPTEHWQAFETLCNETSLSGDLIPDGYIAAAAMQLDAELISADKDFGRFPNLHWSSIPTL